MKEQPSAEKPEQIARERAQKLRPTLQAFHDIFEDRSVMGNRETADRVAEQFTQAGVEVFADFANDLKEAKARQTEESEE